MVRTGSKIVDGDDEQDNVVNAGLTFARVDMAQLAKGIHRSENKERHEDGHRDHRFAKAYAQRCWVKDFLSEASTTVDDRGDDFYRTGVIERPRVRSISYEYCASQGAGLLSLLTMK